MITKRLLVGVLWLPLGMGAIMVVLSLGPQAVHADGDFDGDGSSDAAEAQTAPGSEAFGGRRDPDNPWDYLNPGQDGRNRVDDILLVVHHYFHQTGDPAYSDRYDRTYTGPNPWNLGPPNGQIRVDDILSMVQSYFHDCGRKEPVYTQSRYMKSTNFDALYAEGSRQATGKGLLMLAFGQPQWNGQTHGTWLYNNSFASISAIEDGVHGFVAAYYYDSPVDSFIHVGIGTSNNFGYTGENHGTAWAFMVNRINDWLAAADFDNKVTAYGAIDIETAWANPTDTRAWVDGYASVNQWAYYNFGDAGGCPPYGSCNGDWTQEAVWYVSWGSPPALVLPEIYYGDPCLACQWYEMSVYSYLNHGGKIYFSGALTQWDDAHPSCNAPISTNKPWEGYSQLLWALNKDQRTAQDLEYSSDIVCWEGSW